MYIRTENTDWIKYVPLFFVGLLVVLIVVVIFYLVLKNKDKSKPLVTKRVTILEKPVQQANVEWYLLECEDGERLKLRSFKANQTIITVGDKGIVKFRGKTIESFQRE